MQNQQPPSKVKTIECPDNVLPCIFDHEFKMQTLTSIKYWGIDRTKASLIAGGIKPTVAKVIIKDIISKYGW